MLVGSKIYYIIYLHQICRNINHVHYHKQQATHTNIKHSMNTINSPIKIKCLNKRYLHTLLRGISGGNVRTKTKHMNT